MPVRLRTTRLGLVAAAGLTLALVPSAAFAHVRVVPEQTIAGGWTVLTFRVPNESATAATSSVSVDLPTDTPLLSVSTQPVPGWTATVTTDTLPTPVDVSGTEITEAPSTVTWTADPGAEVTDGQFQEFEISVGPLPEAGTQLVLPTHQTYTDGTVVDWDEVAQDGGAEPDHPAPELTTTSASSSDTSSSPDASSSPGASSDSTARILGVAGLALGVVALVVALLGRRRRGDA